MASEKTESIQRVVQEDPRYTAQAYYFIFDALDYTLQNMEKARHVTGPELLQGLPGQDALLAQPLAIPDLAGLPLQRPARLGPAIRARRWPGLSGTKDWCTTCYVTSSTWPGRPCTSRATAS